VLLMGDSRMAEWGVPDLGRWRVLNAGAPGWTTGQIRQQTRNLLAQFQPDTVVLQAGINDLKFLGVRPALEDSVVALAHSNLVAIVNECVEHRCKVIVLEVWPSGQPTLVRRWIWNKAVASSTDQLNAQLRELNSPERGVWVVDLFQRAGVKPGPEPFRDILHFTTETYQQLTGALRKELDVALPADRRQ
jgi:lysophospholipase L1-like esterase